MLKTVLDYKHVQKIENVVDIITQKTHSNDQ